MFWLVLVNAALARTHAFDGVTEVHALPTVRLHPPVQANTTSPIGPDLSAAQLEFRLRRARELDGLFSALSWAIPAEVNAALGSDWQGRVVRARLRPGARRALAEALRATSAAAPVAGRPQGTAPLLVTWIDEVAGSPMTLASLPGEVVDTPVGPVVIDATNEPFLVRATIGAALVAPDGTVICRSHGRYEAVLRGDHALDVTALELAQAVAASLLQP